MHFISRLYQGVNTGTDNDFASSGHTSNGKFHRVLKGTQALCPPLLPFTSNDSISFS